MLEYVYIVKCPDCEDEHFYFFNDAKDFALASMSRKPIITQVEVNRNDFGECTDSHDLGTVWSWEDMMKTEDEPTKSVFTKADLKCTDCDTCPNGNCPAEDDPEFDNLDNSLEPDIRKPVPDNITIKQLVEEMEENEDTVECVGCEELFLKDDCFYKEGIGWLCGDCEDVIVRCTWCEELFDKGQCRKEVDLGWLCSRCEAAIKSRGETLTFKENDYWDFLDEQVEETLAESEGEHDDTPEVDKQEAAEALADKINQKASAEERAAMLKKIAAQIPPSQIEAVTSIFKSKIKDYNLTEEDKNILKNKTKINPKVIDKADSILTLINSSLDGIQAGLPVLGAIIDIVHLVVPDEAIAAVCPPVAALLTLLSYLPDGIIISILLDFGITALRGLGNLAKNAVVSLVNLKDDVTESFLEELEDPEVYRKRLTPCPECGDEHAFDRETGFCLNCGFN